MNVIYLTRSLNSLVLIANLACVHFRCGFSCRNNTTATFFAKSSSASLFFCLLCNLVLVNLTVAYGKL
jgi:hypothetical protein